MIFNAEEHISSLVNSMPPSGIRKFFDLVAERPDALSLSIGEPDFVTPEKFRAAAIRSLNEGKTAYTANLGIIELRTAISVYLKNRFNIGYNPSNEMIITVGGSEAIDISLRGLLNQGDEVLIPEPGFVAYRPCVEMAGGKAIAIPTCLEDDFKINIANLDEYVSDKTKLLILNYPCNPTGVTLSKSDLEQIADFIIRHNMMVISDEIYAELTYDAEHYSIAALPGMKERTITISGFSKAFAMTGWRIGYLCADARIVKVIAKVHQYVLMCAHTISQYAALEAITNGAEEVKLMVDEYQRRRDFIVGAFKRIGLPIAEPGGAFYAFPCIKGTGLSSEEFCTRFLQEQNVAVVPGSAFGESGEGFIRCSYAASLEKLSEAMRRMEIFINSIKTIK